jgi:multimeric flavodoxin WrbA
MADSIETGAHAAAEEMGMTEQFVLDKRYARDATVADVLAADGYLFCAPENLASTSGEMLEFFHRTYYHVFDAHGDEATGRDYTEESRLLGRPCGVAVAAGSDGSTAAAQMLRICRGWRLAPVRDALIVKNGQRQTAEAILWPKECPSQATKDCEELGALLAATVLLALPQ